MRFPANAINYRIPKEIPTQQAALVEPLVCAIHAVRRADIQLGDVVVIAGMGPIGLYMLSTAGRRQEELERKKMKDEHRVLITAADKMENIRQIERLVSMGYTGNVALEPFRIESRSWKERIF
jgi:D-arabinose 1-dehydrogenase-like Zn-dependent alcohol dehydrogenase